MGIVDLDTKIPSAVVNFAAVEVHHSAVFGECLRVGTNQEASLFTRLKRPTLDQPLYFSNARGCNVNCDLQHEHV